MAQKRKKTSGGGKRMQEMGYKPLQLWLDRDDYAIIHDAALADDRPMTRFVRAAAVCAAQAFLLAEQRKRIAEGTPGREPGSSDPRR